MVPGKKTTKVPPLKILRRFHFSSQMKRMTVIAGYQLHGQSDTHCLVSVKGAPEVLKYMVSHLPSCGGNSFILKHSNCNLFAQFKEVPSYYDVHYQRLAQAGARVIALGIRELGNLSTQQIRETPRQQNISFKF